MAPDIPYVYNKIPGITFKYNGHELSVDTEVVKKALRKTDLKIEATPVEVFEVLGMRNLSAFVGELFARSLMEESGGFFMKNPHQDGYPDLLAMTTEGRKLWDSLKNNLQDKHPFSPFMTGGIEVKATCGSVPTPAVFAKKNLKKPDIGDQRIDFVRGYDWKAHHRLTNNLFGIVWDFIDKKPIIVGMFYSSDLTENDWGQIIQPKAGGGRTTSVSIMTRPGIEKMYQGWVAVIKDKRYASLFDRVNKSDLIASHFE